MTVEDKIQLVWNLINAVGNDIEEKIMNGTIPEEWNGIELRAYIAELCNRNVAPFHGQRKEDYINTLIVITL